MRSLHTATKRGPHSPELEKTAQQQRPRTVKNKIKLYFKERKITLIQKEREKIHILLSLLRDVSWKTMTQWRRSRKPGYMNSIFWLLIISYFHILSVQSLSCVWLFVTPWTAACQASLSITNSRSLLKLMSIKSVTPSNHLILCSPLLLLSIFPSIRIFSSESVLRIRWPKYWSFSFSVSPSNDYSGWTGCISLQSKGLSRAFSNTTVQKHQFFGAQLSLYIVQLSHPYMTAGKTITLTRWTFVDKSNVSAFEYAV